MRHGFWIEPNQFAVFEGARTHLYVGATRARDHLAVSWNDEPSEFIAPALEDTA